MWDAYYQVSDFQDAVEILDKFKTNAKIIAGGTDLWLENKRGLHKEIEVLIDISRINGGDNIYSDGEGFIHIGPLVTHSHCVRSELIKENAFCLHQACASVGSPQIRNRGTIAGNVFTASPANDSISALMVLDAIVVVTSVNGKREIPIKDLYTGVRKHRIEKNEIITDIKFKKLNKSESISFFIKHALRKAQAISLINISVLCKETSDGKIQDLRIALGSIAPTVIRVNKAEEYAKGKSWKELDLVRLCALATEKTSPITDLRSPADYRKQMVAVLMLRAISDYLIDKKPLPQPDRVTLWGDEKGTYHPLGQKQIIMDGGNIEFTVNGKNIIAKNVHGRTLLDIIRDSANLKGSKEGCGEGECGACTVYMDGVAVLACLIPAERAQNSEIITIESYSENGEISKLQNSFIEENAVQCGYCTPGFIMSGAKLLEENKKPTQNEIKTAISGNLCRCTGYYKIIKAIEKAAE